MDYPIEFQSRTEHLIFTIHPNGLAEFRLNRPSALNALSEALIIEIIRLLHLIEPLPQVSLLLFWSADPKAFSAGGDVVKISKSRFDDFALPAYPVQAEVIRTPATPTTQDPAILQQQLSGHITSPQLKEGCLPAFSELLQPTWNRDTYNSILDVFHTEYSLFLLLSSYSKPSVSLLSGLCLGGGFGLAMSTTVRLGSTKLQMAMPETKIGFFPDVGASLFLKSSAFGQAAGRFIGCCGYKMNCAEVLKLGLIDLAFDEAQYMSVYSALKAVPGFKLQEYLAEHQTPPILIQETNIPVLHRDSLSLNQATHKHQTLTFLAYLTTFVSPPARSHHPFITVYDYPKPVECMTGETWDDRFGDAEWPPDWCGSRGCIPSDTFESPEER